MKNENQLSTIIFGLIGAVTSVAALLILLPILSGWVLSVLWGWFIVPAFHLPALSIPAAIGVSLIAGKLTHQFQHEPENAKPWKVLAFGILSPFMTLAMGYVVRSFM